MSLLNKLYEGFVQGWGAGVPAAIWFGRSLRHFIFSSGAGAEQSNIKKLEWSWSWSWHKFVQINYFWDDLAG